ncbi:DNA-(apurinic or apyrimidinic site) lyase /endonuclease III [Candidatus Kryptonium thompsonii]|uniref:Endonuclease III n=2 Tax=Candidatus Kryptonium thompsonii TaxID=1633631 RepID=A0A0P1MII9_9BACT|nr:endonuclease III [Candidatus Kryptonium thompsoni]CUS80774.1 DNA-(apurinic or apyrimidinic site) lyase /endonuclease III [Candidatus Kryptonium thompsoni]CUS82066.1 DNA-(apurinic or apyrimidinic site) lyase /endonuclease III [Candidatus Kryptonium thompsoni]CUS83730.1 DNA-(apurinic or apyrimidinic site) lyase /endonuclease III [Candidatus Kryptonium thompsoni]CUS84695.1 DNA-(apurinic or apyrimidinic site) lyase /endonuclease III [Candidatus Kryptonium thompsoni]CUS94972.1 DNA-(apurinic or a
MSKKSPFAKETLQEKKKRVSKIINVLKKLYPNAKTHLNFSNPLELLVATILAAQCTDERVNKVTEYLFKKYQTAQDYANADLKVLEQEIRPTGFYKNKAKAIKNCCQVLVEKYNGQVPDTLEELVELPGVGRKTANAVLANAFGKDGIIVDTHLKRVTARLGLVKSSNPDKIEFELMEIVPKGKWTLFSHLIGEHGRYVCEARKPKCSICKINKLCPSAKV